MGKIHGFVLDAKEKRAKFSSLNQQVFQATGNKSDQSTLKVIREFRIPRRQRPPKHHLKSEFGFFQSLSRLLQLNYNYVKCKRTLFEPNEKENLAVACLRKIRHFPW